LLDYSPYPAEPGNYVTVTLMVRNTGNSDAGDVRIRIVPQYPFSLDSNPTARISNSANPVPLDSNMTVSLGKLPASHYTMVEFRLRIDSKALEGDNQIEFWYQLQPSSVYVIDTFDIYVQGTDELSVGIDPFILAPGRPTEATVVLRNQGTASIRDMTVKLSEETKNILVLGSGNVIYVSTLPPGITVKRGVTLAADSNAVSGAYVMAANITYTVGSNISKSMDVDIGMFIGGAGDFDIGVQESQSLGSISLSVANIGVNPASSVLVRIPEQDNFTVTGPSTSFIGNLNPGDFTLASFLLSYKGEQEAPQLLDVEISYTDTNGIRQTVNKEVYVSQEDLGTRQSSQPGSSGQSGSGLGLIITGFVGIVLVVLLFRYRKSIGKIFSREE
jgi:hypothetical protein